MAKASFPLYDIYSIDNRAGKDLLVERFGSYLKKHYNDLQRPHRHSFYHLVLFTEGKGSHTIDFEKFTVKPYQIYFMIPGQVHSWHFEGKVDGYVVHFNEVIFSAFLQNSHYLERFYFFQGKADESVWQLPAPIRHAVKGIFETLISEVESAKPVGLDLIRIKLIELFLTVQRNCVNKKENKVSPPKMMLLRSFQRLIEKHYLELKLPKQYADLLYVTPNHLNALSKQLVGKTAGDLIRDRVLLEAKRLLTTADMTVAEISYALNFEDNSYFSRFFKKYEGMTPEEFRKSVINQ